MIFLKHIYITHTIYICVCKSFSNTLDKALIKNIKKKKEEMEKLENKLNEMGALNVKQKK